MKLLNILLVTLITFSITGNGVFAHSSHSHAAKPKVTEIKVKAIVTTQVNRLMEKKKLESSWGQFELKDLVKKKFGPREEWVATLVNTKASAEDKKTLYVFIDLYGNFIAANFTGK